jgi:excisionase family DNA binding protein
MTDRRALRISEVAESIGVDHETVRRWVVSGKLRGVRVGGVWLVPVEGLDLLLEGYDAATWRTATGRSRSDRTAGSR